MAVYLDTNLTDIKFDLKADEVEKLGQCLVTDITIIYCYSVKVCAKPL